MRRLNGTRKKAAAGIALMLFVFLLLISVMHIVPFFEAPDEDTRYAVAHYIYSHGRLPVGSDPEIKNSLWGNSYAYQPVNAYIVQAGFMRIAGAFGVADQYLYLAARFANVLLSLGTVLLCLLIGSRLFSGIFIWTFTALVSLLPQFLFVSGYCNSDTLAVFCTALLIWCLLKSRSERWSVKSCIFLGAAAGLEALSYYNVFGVLLVSFFYCIAAVAIDDKIERKGTFILTRAGITAASAFAVSGWWFIRNAFLYHGDFIGLKASEAEAEIWAIEELKPSVHMTPKRAGYSMLDVLRSDNWRRISCRSYVAGFSWMSLFAGKRVYRCFRAMIHFLLSCWAADVLRTLRRRIRADKQTVLFYGSLIAMCGITVLLSLIRSYVRDYEPQGRYFFPMLIPFALLCTKGLSLFGRLFSEKAGRIIAALIIVFMTCISVYCVYGVLLRHYAEQLSALLRGIGS